MADTMPDKLKLFLETLNKEDAEELLEYLDSNEDAVIDMIVTLTSTTLPERS